MTSRRNFLKTSTKLGMASATASLWNHSLVGRALAQMPSSTYKAVIVIELAGGNDANNMIVPMDSASFAEYTALRGCLALPISTLNPLQSTSMQVNYGLHPSLVNISRLYNQQRAAVVCNVGPITAPTTKTALMSGRVSYPDSLLSHTDQAQQWETASAYDSTITGWGGRLADQIVNQSGVLPPVLNAGAQSWFTVGQSVQAVAVQGGGAFPALPPNCQSAINDLANVDLKSGNALVAQAAKIRQASLVQQAILTQAAVYRPLKTTFGSGFSQTMQTIAQIIAGRSVVGATRQIFYAQQGAYDTHENQLNVHAGYLSDLDQGLGSFFEAMDEIGLSNQVLVCTHSDFNRSFTSNVNGGSDHAWGSHQLLLGGGIKGGQILGKMPTLELNGPDDQDGQGVWIPSTSVVQLVSSIGSWMGLSTSQLNTVYPELKNFPAGPLVIT